MERAGQEPVDVRVVQFHSADGTRLEGDLLSPASPIGSAVVCHPHPLYGGSRTDAVVAAISRALVQAGHRVLRFDFRGTGDSDGTHDGGRAERDDILAAIDEVDSTGAGLVLAGYSFGADIALTIDHPTIERWIVAAPPLAIVSVDDMVAPRDPRRVDVLGAAHDQFNPADDIARSLASWTNSHLHVFDTADHFFGGCHGAIADVVSGLFDPR